MRFSEIAPKGVVHIVIRSDYESGILKRFFNASGRNALVFVVGLKHTYVIFKSVRSLCRSYDQKCDPYP
jgi:hypothetical protein